MDENKIVVRGKYETEYWAKSMSIGSVQKIELKTFWGKKQKKSFPEEHSIADSKISTEKLTRKIKPYVCKKVSFKNAKSDFESTSRVLRTTEFPV